MYDNNKIKRIRKLIEEYDSVDVEEIEDNGDLLSTPETARLFGVTPQTIRNWDVNGKLKPDRYNKFTGHRFYSRKKILDIINQDF